MALFEIRRSSAVVSFMYCLFALSACSEGIDQATTPTRDGETPAPISVQVASLTRAEIVEPIFATGTVAAQKTTNIVPNVGGLIEEIYVAVGDKVEEGAPLVRLRQSDFELNVERSTHARNLALAELEDAERDLESAVKLRQKDMLSNEQFEDRQTRVSVANAKLGIAEADLARSLNDLEDSIVRAPYRAVITKRFVDEGAFVPSVMRSERPVLQIQKIDIVIVVLSIPERHLPNINVGMPGEVHIPSLNTSYESKVVLINDRLDLKTRTMDVRLGIPNPTYSIKPGLFAEVTLAPQARTVNILPPDALLGTADNRFVFVSDSGKAVSRRVEVQELQDRRVVLKTGLDATAKIIVGSNRYLLQNGTPVLEKPSPHVGS